MLAISNKNLNALNNNTFINNKLIVYKINNKLKDVASAVNAYY
jgi:hypothetical protein